MTEQTSPAERTKSQPVWLHALLYGAALAVVYLSLAIWFEPLPTTSALDENSDLYMAGFLVVFIVATLAWRFPQTATLCLVGSTMSAPMSAQTGVPSTETSILGVGFMSLLVFIPFFFFVLPGLLKAVDDASNRNQGALPQG